MCNPKNLTSRYLMVLNEQLGWDASADEDGDVVFSCSEVFESAPFFVWVDNHAPHDPEYLRMHTGIPLSAFGGGADGGADSLIALAALLTREKKGVKVCVDQDFVTFSVELVMAAAGCMPTADHLVGVLPRVRRMLGSALVSFSEAMMLRGIEATTEAADAVGD